MDRPQLLERNGRSQMQRHFRLENREVVFSGLPGCGVGEGDWNREDVKWQGLVMTKKDSDEVSTDGRNLIFGVVQHRAKREVLTTERLGRQV